jgi:hypothetical protein
MAENVIAKVQLQSNDNAMIEIGELRRHCASNASSSTPRALAA